MKALIVMIVLAAVTACEETRAGGWPRVYRVRWMPPRYTWLAKWAAACSRCRIAEGDRVQQGDIIARLDTRDVELALQRAQAERAQADAQLRLLQAGARVEDVRQAEAQVVGQRGGRGGRPADLGAAETDLQRFEQAPPEQFRIAKTARRCRNAEGRGERSAERGTGARDGGPGSRGSSACRLPARRDRSRARACRGRRRADRDARKIEGRRHDRRPDQRASSPNVSSIPVRWRRPARRSPCSAISTMRGPKSSWTSR